MNMYHERYVGEAEYRPLLMGLPEEADDLRSPGLRPHPLGSGLVDVLGGDEVEDDGDQPRVLDSLVPGRWVVDGDPGPEELPEPEPAPGRVEPLVEFVDLVGEEAGDGGAEEARELGVQQMAQRLP